MLKTILTYEDIKKFADAGKPIHLECPHCRAQFLPGEIYSPGALIGQPYDVVKDSTGKILCVDYQEVNKMPNNIETYICDFCGQPFDIEAGYITYKTKPTAPEKDFSTEYVPLY